ncbi:MAG: hypothetical protein E7439_06005 [Ruminococcaceae bacterium]|nr:hypothetical protein [Oscillospiraceae bacterium]
MKNNKEILSSVLKTTQMGQIGIRTVEDKAKNPELKQALESQLREYDTIEREAHNIAEMRGWVLPELNPGVRAMSEMMTRMKLTGGGKDSKIAGMMIQGNTRGIITGLKNLHQYPNRDRRIEALSEKLLEKENDNIRQMEPFL